MEEATARGPLAQAVQVERLSSARSDGAPTRSPAGAYTASLVSESRDTSDLDVTRPQAARIASAGVGEAETDNARVDDKERAPMATAASAIEGEWGSGWRYAYGAAEPSASWPGCQGGVTQLPCGGVLRTRGVPQGTSSAPMTSACGVQAGRESAGQQEVVSVGGPPATSLALRLSQVCDAAERRVPRGIPPPWQMQFLAPHVQAHLQSQLMSLAAAFATNHLVSKGPRGQGNEHLQPP